MGPGVGLQRTDILPVALGHAPVEQRLLPAQQAREDVGREVHHAVADEIEDPGLENVDAGVYGVGENLPPRRFFQEALHGAVGPGHDYPELEGVGHGPQRDGRQGLFPVVEIDDGAQVDIRKHIARNDQERLVQCLHGVADRTRRAERWLFTGVDDPAPNSAPLPK